MIVERQRRWSAEDNVWIDETPKPDPQPSVVMLQQALAAFRQGDMATADDLLTRVLLLDPGNPHGLGLLGLVAEKRGDLETAERLIERSVQMAPHSRSRHNLGVVKAHRGDLDGAIASYRAAVREEPDYADAWTNLIFTMDLHPHATPAMLRAVRDEFDRACCVPLTALWAPHENDRTADRRLRVGYVGGDFRARHSAASSFGWIADHDPEAVEVFLYSTYPGDDPTAERFKERADVWCEIGHLSPFELASVIREDRIDILVDLGGASQGGRVLTFACRPAPVQVGGWGYAHGLGIGAMDYMVGDAVSTPVQSRHHYREQILEAPLLMGYRHEGPLPDVGEPPQDRNGYRTYGYLGRAMKLTAPTLALWAEVLLADPTSRLLLKHGQFADRKMRGLVVDGLTALGVAPERIEIRGETSRTDHLVAYRDVDVALDPLIHNGGQTVGDALLMGVPTVTMPTEMVSGRIGAAFLSVVGIEDWVAHSPVEYIGGGAVDFYLSRQELRDRFLASTICDGPSYAKAVEDAYRQIWAGWCGR